MLSLPTNKEISLFIIIGSIAIMFIGYGIGKGFEYVYDNVEITIKDKVDNNTTKLKV